MGVVYKGERVQLGGEAGCLTSFELTNEGWAGIAPRKNSTHRTLSGDAGPWANSYRRDVQSLLGYRPRAGQPRSAQDGK